MVLRAWVTGGAAAALLAGLVVGCGDDSGRWGRSGADALAPNPSQRADEPPLLPREPKPTAPASARMSLQNAFGSETFVGPSYASQADRDADARDGVLDVTIVDAEDGSPVPFARVAVSGLLSGEALRLQAREDGRVRIEGVPRIWLGLLVSDPATDAFARRHAFTWRFVHGPGELRVRMPRELYLRFRLEGLPSDAQPDSLEVAWERVGAEGLQYGVMSNEGSWSLRADDPRAIALPPGTHRVTFRSAFDPDLPKVVLTEATATDAVRAVRFDLVAPIGGRVAWAGTPIPGASLDLEMRSRVGRWAVDSTTFGRRGRVSSRSAGGGTSTVSSNVDPSGADAVEGGWRFTAPPFASEIPVDLIARARVGSEVVATAYLADVRPGTQEAHLLLRPATEVSGRVLDAEGAPVAGATVAATWACEAVSPQSVLATVESGPDGGFVFRGLPDVLVRVLAGGQGYAVYTPEPWTGHPSSAGPVELRTAPTLSSVRGTIRDRATGLPLGLNVHLQQETVSAVGQGFSAHADGAWRGRHLVPGPARVALDFHGMWLAELPPVEITQRTCDLTLDLPGDEGR